MRFFLVLLLSALLAAVANAAVLAAPTAIVPSPRPLSPTASAPPPVRSPSVPTADLAERRRAGRELRWARRRAAGLRNRDPRNPTLFSAHAPPADALCLPWVRNCRDTLPARDMRTLQYTGNFYYPTNTNTNTGMYYNNWPGNSGIYYPTNRPWVSTNAYYGPTTPGMWTSSWHSDGRTLTTTTTNADGTAASSIRNI